MYRAWTIEDVIRFNFWLRQFHQSGVVGEVFLNFNGGAEMQVIKPPNIDINFSRWTDDRFEEFEAMRLT